MAHVYIGNVEHEGLGFKGGFLQKRSKNSTIALVAS